MIQLVLTRTNLYQKLLTTNKNIEFWCSFKLGLLDIHKTNYYNWIFMYLRLEIAQRSVAEKSVNLDLFSATDNWVLMDSIIGLFKNQYT